MNTTKMKIERMLGDGYSVEIVNVSKTNGVRKDGFCVRKVGDMVGKVFYTTDADDIVKQVKAGYDPAFKEVQKVFNDKDAILKHVIPQLVNYERNKNLLKERPHRKIADLAIQYRCEVGFGTFVITDTFGFTEDELYRAAKWNCKDKWTLKDLGNMLGVESTGITVGTNKDGLYGAAIIMSDLDMLELTMKYNGDFYVIPSSTHEILALGTKEHNVDDIVGIIKSVNEQMVDAEDFLSDNLYIYRNGTLEVAK